jgi:hypothetical protein
VKHDLDAVTDGILDLLILGGEITGAPIGNGVSTG